MLSIVHAICTADIRYVWFLDQIFTAKLMILNKMFYLQNNMIKWCILQETTDSISDSGELSVSLLHNENNHRLTVSVLEARNLKVRL